MKKLLSLLVFAAFALSANVSNAQVYSQGNVVVDAFYGFPNLFTSIVRTGYNSSVYSNVKIGSVGPLGGTAEYLLSEKIGIGLEATYASTSVKYDYYDSYDNATYSYDASYNRLRILPRLNVHFGNSDKVDPYLTLGIGYGNFKLKYTTNDPNGGSVADIKTPAGVSSRVGFGVRYFFSDHIGAMVEFGVGGPLARAGLALKF